MNLRKAATRTSCTGALWPGLDMSRSALRRTITNPLIPAFSQLWVSKLPRSYQNLVQETW